MVFEVGHAPTEPKYRQAMQLLIDWRQGVPTTPYSSEFDATDESTTHFSTNEIDHHCDTCSQSNCRFDHLAGPRRTSRPLLFVLGCPDNR